MNAANAATQPCQSCRPEQNLSEAVQILWEANTGALPVVDAETRLVGIITDRDIAIAAGTRNRLAAEIRVEEVAVRSVVACSPETGLRDALVLMQTRKVRRLPMVDDEGRLLGLLTLEDVARTARPTRTGKGDVTHEDIVRTLIAIESTHDAFQAGALQRLAGVGIE